MKVALCCIGRMENRYAVEYVEYYKSIGFDKIFIYDNNHDGEEHFEEVLQQYVDDGFVEITNYRNKTHCQLESYQDCYNKHKNEYDWIAFFDFDEFLTFAKGKDAKEYLSRFNGYDIVKVNWMVYTDNNLIKNDGRRVLERFATPMEYDKRITYPFPENNHIKSIVKGGLGTVRWGGTPHIPLGNAKCCDSVGNVSDNSPFHPYNFELAYLRHYPTKTIDKFYSVKVQRGYPDGHKDFFKQNDWTVQFFKYNTKTDEKVNFIKSVLRGKINVFIVNFNTQDLTDACIRSLNKNTPNTKIYLFDNSDKQPFINTFSNVTVINNTKGQIIDFKEWLRKYKDKAPMSNNYGSAKHCYTIEKFMEMFDDNFIMIDSDALVKKDISELYDDKYMYVGEEIEKVAFWKPRVVPYILFINNRMCKEKGVHFFDENRCTQVKRKVYYDTGASFLEDASKYEHKTIKCSDYIEHFGAGSWQKIKTTSKIQGEWLNKFKHLWAIDNTDIFICTHKDFKPIVKNEVYKVIDSRNIHENYFGVDDKFYSELYQYFYIADNYKLKDYIGFCGYRKYFSFMDDIPNMDEVFKENDVIIGKPKAYGTSIRQFYDHCHNIDDLDIVENIIKEKYFDYYNIFKRYMNQKMFIQCNMFIMRREDFLIYIKFIKDVLDEYLKIVGTDIYKRIEDNKDKYLKKNYPNNTVEYQYRIGGYLAERLTGVFICKHFKRARAYEIKITEKKY